MYIYIKGTLIQRHSGEIGILSQFSKQPCAFYPCSVLLGRGKEKASPFLITAYFCVAFPTPS